MGISIDEKLALDLFHVDQRPHIEINKDICRTCDHKICTYICPVENYKLDGDEIVFSWEGCLECGTCRIACDKGSITWDYPRGGFGIAYRY